MLTLPPTVRQTRVPALALGCVVLAVAYVLWAPLVPDLAAQVARAGQAGNSWWTSWYGGITLPDYSVLAPTVMSVVGVRLTGVLSVVLFTLCAQRLTADSLRPRAATVAFAVAAVADVLDGRITFALGIAVAAAALTALKERWELPAVVGAALAYLASPLAGLFLGVAAAVTAVLDSSRRRTGVGMAVVLLALGGASAVLFQQTGRMPFRFNDIVPAGLCCLGVALVCANRYVRVAAMTVLAATVVVLIEPGAIGTNITRLAWLVAAPLAVAYCPLRRAVVAVVVAALALWPVCDLARQVHSALAASVPAGFSTPVISELHALDAGVHGDRVEIVDSRDHWPDVYVGRQFDLARGWDRQADAANNPLFYDPGALSAASYRQWLDDLAVGWVAVPSTPHDYAAVAEARLIGAGLPYLTQVWSTPDWTLYQVDQAAPLVRGATVVGGTDSSLLLSVTGATTASVQVRWTPYLRVEPAGGGAVPGACLARRGAWVDLHLPGAGTYRIVSHLDVSARFDSTTCR